VFFGQRVDDLFGALDLSLGDLDPNVLEDIGSWPNILWIFSRLCDRILY
jgi:hypothetical protein